MPATAKKETALVLFSGGQDSTTCLAWALDRFEHVETIGFDYGLNSKYGRACSTLFAVASLCGEIASKMTM